MTFKFTILLLHLGFCIFKVAECAMTKEQVENMMNGIRKGCTSKVPVDLALVDGIRRGEFPDDQNLKSYMRCVLKMTKGIKNGKIDSNMLIAQVSMLPTNADSMIETIKKCAPAVTGTDDNDLAWNYIKCLYETDPETFFFP